MRRQLALTLLMFVLVACMLACNIGSNGLRSTEVLPELTASLAVQSMASPSTPTQSFTATTQSPAASPTLELPTLTPTLGIGSKEQSTTDGMIQLFVPAGQFTMGGDDYDDYMSAPVYLDAFWIDQTEVTNAMFEKFVSAMNYRTDAEKHGVGFTYDFATDSNPKTIGANWQHPHGPNSALKGLEQYPVVQVSWNDAVAYCHWAGRQLPTEAEWEKAARGTDGRLFPWGNQDWAGNLANLMDRQLNPAYPIDDGYAGIAPVGSFPDGASPYGALDMTGNVAEWVKDWYTDPYPQGNQTKLVINPQGPASGEGRSMRGGAWTSDDLNEREKGHTFHRSWNKPNISADSAGFRCAASN
jgi:formylglycine-generating enzyme required for sulfatase activity